MNSAIILIAKMFILQIFYFHNKQNLYLDRLKIWQKKILSMKIRANKIVKSMSAFSCSSNILLFAVENDIRKKIKTFCNFTINDSNVHAQNLYEKEIEENTKQRKMHRYNRQRREESEPPHCILTLLKGLLRQ